MCVGGTYTHTTLEPSRAEFSIDVYTVNSRDEIAEQVSDFGKHTVVVPVVLDHTSVDAGLADRWTNLQSTDCVAHHPQSVHYSYGTGRVQYTHDSSHISHHSHARRRSPSRALPWIAIIWELVGTTT